jgi:hypothetical protein
VSVSHVRGTHYVVVGLDCLQWIGILYRSARSSTYGLGPHDNGRAIMTEDPCLSTCTDVSHQDLLPVAISGGWISAAVYCMRRNNLPTFQPLVPAGSFVKPCHCNRGLARAAWPGYCEVRTETGV